MYARSFGEPRFSEESYGYWVSVAGALLVLGGVLVYLLGTMSTRGSPVFWTTRQAGVVLAGAGVPLLVLGFVYRLPVSEGVYRTATAGVVVCVVALAAFVRFYPDGWNVQPGSPVTDRSSQVTAVYAVGFLFVVFSATVLPVLAERRDEVLDSVSVPESGARFEVFRDVSADWRWVLRDGEGTTVADSDVGYPTESDAERSVKEFRDEVFGASVETRDVLDEYLRTGAEEVDFVEGGGQPALESGTAETVSTERTAETTTEATEEAHESRRQRASSSATPSPNQDERASHRPIFEVYDEGDGTRWRLVDERDDAVAFSPLYSSWSEAEDSARSVRNDAQDAEILVSEPACVAVYRDGTGRWRWSLRGDDGEVVAVTGDGGYVERDGVDTALERLGDGEETEARLYEAEDGWRWSVRHANGETLAESPTGHDDRDEAEKTAGDVSRLVSEADVSEVGDTYFVVHRRGSERDGNARWEWRLVEPDGRTLAFSGDVVHADAEVATDAVDVVRSLASDAVVG